VFARRIQQGRERKRGGRRKVPGGREMGGGVGVDAWMCEWVEESVGVLDLCVALCLCLCVPWVFVYCVYCGVCHVAPCWS
jgi:hypothetical protein